MAFPLRDRFWFTLQPSVFGVCLAASLGFFLSTSPLSTIGLAAERVTPKAPPVGWPARIVGRYESRISNETGFIPAITQWQLSAKKGLTGSYQMNEQGRWVPGTLSNCQPLQMQVLRCTWKDRYGTGDLELTFSENFASFEGVWNRRGHLEQYVWSGYRMMSPR